MFERDEHDCLGVINFGTPRPWIRWAAVVLAAAGWWLSYDLAKLTYGMNASTPWLQNQCGVDAEVEEDAVFDCRSVLNSEWAKFRILPVKNATKLPTSVLGMGYFAFVGLWFMFVGAPTRSRWARHLLIVAIAFCGTFTSIRMMQIMHFDLHKWCMGCAVTHVINIVLFALTIAAFPWKRDPENLAPHPRGRLALATLAACSFLFLLHLAVGQTLVSNQASIRIQDMYMKIVDDPGYITWRYEKQPVREELLGEMPTHFGDPSASNHVVIFSDYQCPACKKARDALTDLLNFYPGKIRVTYRHFPQDYKCNPYMPQGGHPAACQAAEAVEATKIVGGDGASIKMRELLYERRNELEVADYGAWATELGIDTAAFAEALDSDAVRESVLKDIELGHKLGVKAIPVMYLNGRRLEHWSKIETWEALLNEGVKADLISSQTSSAPE